VSETQQPRFEFELLTNLASRLAELHGVPVLDILSFTTSMLGQCAGPKITFEGRKGDVGWPYLLITPTDEPPPWYTLLMEWPRHMQDGFEREMGSLIRRLTKPELIEDLRATAKHLRSFGDTFSSEVRDTESQIAICGAAVAWKLTHFVDAHGALAPQTGMADALSVVVDGDQDIRRLSKARKAPRSLMRLFTHQNDHTGPRVAGRCSEKAAVKLVRDLHPPRFIPPPVMLPISGGKKCEGCFRSLLPPWNMALNNLLSRRFALLPWTFQPSSAILGVIEEEEAKLAEQIPKLSDAALGYSNQLLRLPGKIVALAHNLETAQGRSSFNHGNMELTMITLRVAGDIYRHALRWLDQTLPGRHSGITPDDSLVQGYIRSFAPMSSLELLRRYTGLTAQKRDESLNRLIKAGFVGRDANGLLRPL
jgi:hypothetical protein